MAIETRNMWTAAACVAALCGACDEAAVDGVTAEEHEAEVQDRYGAGNGPVLNSAVLNGWSLNGFRTNGWSLNGWSLNGWSLNGWSLNSMSLQGSALTGLRLVNGIGVTVSGTELIGSELKLVREGETFTLRFDDIYKNPADPDGDVYFYAISAYDPISATWDSLCKDMYGDPIEAIAIANHWDPITGDRIDDPTAVTLACRGAALAKCVEWGYRPWAKALTCQNGNCSQVSLADHHQACTRMTRADYCGDGKSHTLNATPIDLFDRLTPRIQSQASIGMKQWKIEAEWGPDGALCMGKETRLLMFPELGLEHPDPPCRIALQKYKDCGKFPASRGAQIADAYCPEWISDPAKCQIANDN